MIDYALDAGIARITLDTPDTNNHFTYRLMQDYIAALQQAHDSGADILVIDAKGPDFTLGRDQKEKVPGIAPKENLGLILKANALLRSFPGASVALVQGRAFGFGSGISLHASISLAADDAQFGFDEIAHNLAPLVVVAYLPHFISPRVAEELVLTGRIVSADEALRIGLVTRVVPAARLAEEGQALVRQLSQRHAGAIRVVRKYALGLPGYPTAEQSQAAVDTLAAWIQAGKP
ncbi:Enoyl-CoA hydratase [plant metagenome]|uniref:Enoyl-CoA hydratase n=1 Tax=plant metagenome TaxID=1297885 RepID=A0A484URP7_9ZZZZ